jgi:hypothetical protein
MNPAEKDTRIIISVEGRKPIETTASGLNRLARSLRNKKGEEIMMKKRGMIRPNPGAEKVVDGEKIRKALGGALENRAAELGLKVENVTGLGLKDFQNKEEQRPLFGEVDQIVNVLELERSDIKADIAKCYEAIGRKKEEIDILSRRLDLLEAALVTSKKMAKEATEKKPNKK